MTIHKNAVYAGRLNGRDVRVMPLAVGPDDVAFAIGSAFGNRYWFDNSRTDSMRREAFESTFTQVVNDDTHERT